MDTVSPTMRDDQLLAQFAATRDPLLRAQLVERYLPLAHHVARRLHRGREPFDDLLQVASLGLLKALDRYDPARGAAFSSFAMPTISGEIRRYYRDRTWAVRPPRDLQEGALAVDRARDRLTTTLGRAPTVDEIGEALGLDAEAVLEALEATRARSAVSFSTPATSADDGDMTLQDQLGTVDEGLDHAEQRATLSALARVLTARERQVIELRFSGDMTQSEIGAVIGVSQMQVSRILRDAVEKLRRAAAAASG